MAIRSLIANTMRTFLTALGMIIGVASVISMISIGEGARQQTLSTIAKFGTNIITIKPGKKKTRHVSSDNVNTLVLEDAEAINTHIPLITGVAAQVYRSAQIKYGNKNTNTTVRGTGIKYLEIANFTLDQGRYFSSQEVRSIRRVAVLGSTVVKNLFGDINPIGKAIKVDGSNYLIIGSTIPKGALSWFDPDDQIFIPVTTAQKRLFGVNNIQSIDIQAEKIEDLEIIKERVDSITYSLLLEKVHEVLGENFFQSLDVKFDYLYAIESLKYFDYVVIPKINKVDVPNSVSNVKFNSNLKGLEEFKFEIRNDLFKALG